jgi:hypothetical protein
MRNALDDRSGSAKWGANWGKPGHRNRRLAHPPQFPLSGGNWGEGSGARTGATGAQTGATGAGELVRPRRVTPHRLTTAELLVMYERLAARGDIAAAIRIAMLRREIAYQPTEETSP